METYNQTTHVGYTRWQEQRDIEGIVNFDIEIQFDTTHRNTLQLLISKYYFLSFPIAQMQMHSSHVDTSVCI